MEEYRSRWQEAAESSIDLGQFSELEMIGILAEVRDMKYSPIWDMGIGGSIEGGVVADSKGIYFGAADKTFYALDFNGTLRWKFTTEDVIAWTPSVAAGVVYFGCYDRHVYALSAADGSLVWKFKANDKVVSTPAVHNGVAYFGSKDKRLYAVDAGTGRLRWEFATQGEIESSPLVHQGAVYFGSEDFNFYSLTLDGRLRWKFRTAAGVPSSPAADGDAVYFTSYDRNVYALSTAGRLLWKFAATAPFTLNTPAIHNGLLIAGCRDGVLYAVDAGTGRLRWKFAAQNIISTRPFIADGVIYFGSDDFTFYAVTLDGRLLWKFKTKSINDSPPVVAKGVVYFGSHDCHLYAVDAKTGGLRWKFRTSIGKPALFDMEPARRKEGRIATFKPQEIVPGEEGKYKESGGDSLSGGRSVYTFRSQYVVKGKYGTAE